MVENTAIFCWMRGVVAVLLVDGLRFHKLSTLHSLTVGSDVTRRADGWVIDMVNGEGTEALGW